MMHGYDSWNGVSLASVRQLKGPRLLNAVVRDGVPTNAVVRDGVPASGCACAGMTTLSGVNYHFAVPPTEAAVTVPLAATVCSAAPVEASEILPDGVPEAAPVRRAYIVVEDTVPPVCVSVTDAAKSVVPEVVETSYPVGAVTVISAVKPVPEAVKFWAAEAVPEQEENADNVAVALIIGLEPEM